MIAIVDYGAGNLRSVSRALAAVGAEAQITSNPLELPNADLVLLPGVGAAGDAMAQLAARDLVEPLREAVRSGQPFLGVCLGLQLLFTYSEEDEGTPCLDLIRGAVRRFPGGLKVPHMGWNQVMPIRTKRLTDEEGSSKHNFHPLPSREREHTESPHPSESSGATPGPNPVHPEALEGRAEKSVGLFDGIPDGSHFYFVHSYYGEPEDPSVVAATTEYGLTFVSVLHRDNLVATQFHPEKSAALGLRFYANVLRYFHIPVGVASLAVP